MSDANKALGRRWFEEVWNQGRAATIDELLSPNVVVHGLGPDQHGPEEFKLFHRQYRASFPDINIRVDQVVAEGDMVAIRWSGSGTHRGSDLGIPATGKRVTFSGMLFARVDGGQMVEGWNIFDQFGMLHQLGVVSLPS
jgi:steroid delta-isomerase-like uncharacterized protein